MSHRDHPLAQSIRHGSWWCGPSSSGSSARPNRSDRRAPQVRRLLPGSVMRLHGQRRPPRLHACDQHIPWVQSKPLPDLAQRLHLRRDLSSLLTAMPFAIERNCRRGVCRSPARLIDNLARAGIRLIVEGNRQSVGARGLSKADHRRAQKRRSDLPRCSYRLVSDVSHEASQPQPAVQAIGDIGVLHIIGRL